MNDDFSKGFFLGSIYMLACLTAGQINALLLIPTALMALILLILIDEKKE